MRIPLHHSWPDISTAEHRLLRFNHAESQANAAEIVAGHEGIAKHPQWNKLLTMYDDPMFLRAHPELTDPVERGYFRTMLLQFSVPQDVDVAAAKPEDIVRVPYGIDMTDPRPTMTGIVEPDPLVLDSIVDHYIHSRKTLDELLQKHGVLIPEKQSVDLGLGNNLQREDYVVLLAKAWNGQIADIEAVIARQPDHATAALKQYIHDNVAADGDEILLRTHRLYAEQALEQLGPTDTLRRLGVILGPVTYQAYLDGRALEKDAIPSASTWAARPDHALAFLDGKLPASDGNERFLNALRWYVGRIGGAPDAPADLPMDVDERDVKAMLTLVAQSLQERETAHDSVQWGTHKLIMSRGINLDVGIENRAENLWKFMLDFKKHKIASGALWLAAAGAAALAWQFLTKPRNMIEKSMFFLAAGTVGYGLYQQHTKGEAWWDDALSSFNDWWKGEKEKQPEEQTLPAHWVEKLQLGDHWLMDNFPGSKKNHAEAVLASLSEQKIAPTFDWFEEMRAWEKNPDASSMPRMPALPSKHRRMFGEMPSKERSLLYFGVLKEFFRDRGEYVREHHMQGMYQSALSDDVSLGFEYMRDKYDRGIIYEVIATQFKEQFQVVLDGDPPVRIDAHGLNLNDTDILNRPDVLALKTSKPAAYAMLEKFLAEFRPVRVERDTGSWEMITMFHGEADPEILRRIGRDGARVAGDLYAIRAHTADAVEPYVPAGVRDIIDPRR